MKATPLVSIIVAHYNLGEYLDEAIASCRSQTYSNIEIIVVDDCSTERLARRKIAGLPKKYPDIRLIQNQVNQGSAKTYNIGVEQARGVYCCCLDADDVLEPTYVAKVLACFGSEEKIGFATSWIQLFGESDLIQKTPRYDVPALLIRNLFSSASLFSKQAWKTVYGFDPAMKTYRDWDFWISLVAKGYRWEVVPEPLIRYRDRPYSASKLTVEKNMFFVKKILQKHENVYKKYAKQVIAPLYENVLQLNTDVRALDKSYQTVSKNFTAVTGTRGWKLLEKLRLLKNPV